MDDRSRDDGFDEAPQQRRDAAARPEDLDRQAREAADATWGETGSPRARVPGVLTGEIGPKGTVGSQLRDLSRTERARRSEVPPGAVDSRGGRLALLTMIGLALLMIGVATALGWLTR